MKGFALYLAMVAMVATLMAAGIASATNDLACTFGSYGKVMAESQGRC